MTSPSDYTSSCSPSGSDCWFNTVVSAGKVRKVVYKYTQPPPQCFINGPTSVKVGDHFSVSWSNSANLKTLVSSGWSGPITCWGTDFPDPNACKAKYLGSGGLPACPPETGTCSWAGPKFANYLYFQNPGTSAVTITATDQAGQQGQCSFSVTATAQSSTTGTVDVNAILDGAPWTGPASYTLNGPSAGSGATVPFTFPNRNSGSYSVTRNSGGPA